MTAKPVRTTTIALAGVLLVAGSFVVGHDRGRDSGYGSGYDSGYRVGIDRGHDAGYFDGLSAGVAQGREEGRALQAANEVPAGSRQPVQDAFSAGYAAGSDDAFGNYDGGWGLGEPYLVTVDRGPGATGYHFTSRTALQPNINYYLCPDGRTICQSARR